MAARCCEVAWGQEGEVRGWGGTPHDPHLGCGVGLLRPPKSQTWSPQPPSPRLKETEMPFLRPWDAMWTFSGSSAGQWVWVLRVLPTPVRLAFVLETCNLETRYIQFHLILMITPENELHRPGRGSWRMTFPSLRGLNGRGGIRTCLLSPQPSSVFPVCECLGDWSVPCLSLWFQVWGEVARDLGMKIG